MAELGRHRRPASSSYGPGPPDTPFRENAVTTDGRAGVRVQGAEVQTADEVAELTALGVERGRAVVETTRFVRLASAAARIAPGAMRAISALMAARSVEHLTPRSYLPWPPCPRGP